MSLTKEQIQILGVEPVELYVGCSFIHNIQFYKFIGKDFYISQWDIRREESLVDKDLWCVFAYWYSGNSKYWHVLRVSGEMLRQDPAFLKTYIEESIDKAIKNI